METVIGDGELLAEFKGCIECVFGDFQGIIAFEPWAFEGWSAKHILPGPAEGMPVGDSESEVLGHGFPADDLICIVPFKRKGIAGVRPFVSDLILDFGEKFFAHVFCHSIPP